MARGWESKSIEAQQDEAARAAGRRDRSPEEPTVIRERRRSLELARARPEADLLRACAPAHRDMLRRTLDAIAERLRSLSSST